MILKRLLGRRDARAGHPRLVCALCRRRLARHELPEGYCDNCLRANQTRPYGLTGTRSR